MDLIMKIRKYQPEDSKVLAELFYNTVHFINAKDYTKEQLDVWANKNIELNKWNQSFLEHNTIVAIYKDSIVGFGDMDHTGYLDRLYVHKDYQGMGVATMICDKLEESYHGEYVVTHASITAKSFFERRGYQIIKEQQVKRNGIQLTNYIMKKTVGND